MIRTLRSWRSLHWAKNLRMKGLITAQNSTKLDTELSNDRRKRGFLYFPKEIHTAYLPEGGAVHLVSNQVIWWSEMNGKGVEWLIDCGGNTLKRYSVDVGGGGGKKTVNFWVTSFLLQQWSSFWPNTTWYSLLLSSDREVEFEGQNTSGYSSANSVR